MPGKRAGDGLVAVLPIQLGERTDVADVSTSGIRRIAPNGPTRECAVTRDRPGPNLITNWSAFSGHSG